MLVVMMVGLFSTPTLSEFSEFSSFPCFVFCCFGFVAFVCRFVALAFCFVGRPSLFWCVCVSRFATPMPSSLETHGETCIRVVFVMVNIKHCLVKTLTSAPGCVINFRPRWREVPHSDTRAAPNLDPCLCFARRLQS